MKICMIFCLCAILLFSCKQKVEKLSPTVQAITASVYASGNIKTKNQYQVYAAVNGLVKEILVKEGDLVKKADPIMIVLNETAKLNSENAQIASAYASLPANADKLNELQISIEQAKNKMDNDLLLLQRQRTLWEQNIGTRFELEQRELSYKNALNAYQLANARYNELKKQLTFAAKQAQKNLQISTNILKDFTIKAATDGRVYSILKEKGEMVNTQNPVAVIGDAANFFLELQVDEYDIAQIHIGQKVIVKLDSYKGQVFEATVSKINPIMNEKSKSFTIEAEFTTKPEKLFPNLTAEANIVLQSKEKALLIPRNYIVDDDYVLLQANAQKKQQTKRKVTIGLKDYQQVEILSGLTEKDVIIKPSK